MSFGWPARARARVLMRSLPVSREPPSDCLDWPYDKYGGTTKRGPQPRGARRFDWECRFSTIRALWSPAPLIRSSIGTFGVTLAVEQDGTTVDLHDGLACTREPSGGCFVGAAVRRPLALA
jgi:hypothetical protein